MTFGLLLDTAAFAGPRAALGVAALSIMIGSAAAQQSGQSGANITNQVQSQVSVPLPSLSPLVELVSPSVVNVSVVLGGNEFGQSQDQGGDGSGAPSSPLEQFLRRFFDQQGGLTGPQRSPERQRGRGMALGSGFVIDPDGDIVTNSHVVGNSTNVSVVFPDNSKHRARVVGRDELTDIALLKVDAGKPLAYVSWGDSDASKVGDWVVAVGNPFGLGGTVTSGIISARGRNIEAGPYDDFLQIDASINRGNSGGPTFNLSGQVIGINTAIYSPSGGSVGIGFAVPANLARTIVAQLSQQGHVTRGWLGVQVQEITPEIAKGLGLNPEDAKGALVADVTPNSPAAQAGVKPGDVITRFNGKEVENVHDLPRLVAGTPVGHKVDITVRRGGKEQQLAATITELKPQRNLAAAGGGAGEPAKPKQSSALGLELSPVTDDASKQGSAGGVVVVEVAPTSPAAGLVEPGDVIISINQQPVNDPADAAARLNEGAAKKQILLVVSHGGTNRYAGLPVEEQ
jgi:serine protease Do